MQDIETTLRGNAGSEVELGQGPGWSRATFRLACTPRRLRNGEWVDSETTWITVLCWGRLAEHVQASIAKGDPVLVTGRLRTSAWTKDGQRHERLVVEAISVGHDLSRGTASFTRSASRFVVDDDGQRIDTTTGLVVTGAPAADELEAEPCEGHFEVADPGGDEVLVHD